MVLDHADLEGSRERGEVAWHTQQLGLAGPMRLLQYSWSMFPRSSRPFKSLRAGSARGVSRSVLSALTFGAPLLLLAQSLTSCGSDDDGGGACEPNQIIACAGPGNCAGNQTCAGDGSGFSTCACEGAGSGGSAGAAGAGGGANAGAAGAAGAGGADEPLFADTVRAIGTPCTTDADCPTGPNGEAPLTCFPSDDTEVFVGGGPQGGYCTVACVENEECASLDRLSGCAFLGSAEQGYCLAACTAGADTRLKCAPDRAQACVPLGGDENSTVGACLPSCTSDAACGEGLFCDFGAATGAVGLCTATQPPGGDTGAPCTIETQAADCKSGICVPLGTPDEDTIAGSYCASTCTYLLLDGCGFEGDVSVARDAACLLPLAASGTPGDTGLCVELCDQDADCTQAGWLCVEFAPEGQAEIGRAGQCFPPGLDGLTDGGADAGVGDAGG